MRHARQDYERFQDPANLIPEDEPVFLLRGQDNFGWVAVALYAVVVWVGGGNREVARVSLSWAVKMMAWPKKKLPDLLPAEQRVGDFQNRKEGT